MKMRRLFYSFDEMIEFLDNLGDNCNIIKKVKPYYRLNYKLEKLNTHRVFSALYKDQPVYDLNDIIFTKIKDYSEIRSIQYILDVDYIVSR